MIGLVAEEAREVETHPRRLFGLAYRMLGSAGETAEGRGRWGATGRERHGRARRGVGQPRARFSPAPEKRDQLVRAFLRAAQEGDVAEVERLLAHDATSTSDGGGKMPAARRTI